jgi:hypothetical protein
MLFFRSEEHVDLWCYNDNISKGPLITIKQLWQLAETWYANRLTKESKRPTPDEIPRIFSRVGLEGAFWDLRLD